MTENTSVFRANDEFMVWLEKIRKEASKTRNVELSLAQTSKIVAREIPAKLPKEEKE